MLVIFDCIELDQFRSSSILKLKLLVDYLFTKYSILYVAYFFCLAEYGIIIHKVELYIELGSCETFFWVSNSCYFTCSKDICIFHFISNAGKHLPNYTCSYLNIHINNGKFHPNEN